MIPSARLLFRALAIALIATLCGLAACTGPYGDIGYVPGRGYVVKVSEWTGSKSVNWLVFFPTEAEAHQFYDSYKTSNTFKQIFESIPADRRVSENKNWELYQDLKEQVQPLPRTPLPQLLDPELPQPIPPTPQ